MEKKRCRACWDAQQGAPSPAVTPDRINRIISDYCGRKADYYHDLNALFEAEKQLRDVKQYNHQLVNQVAVYRNGKEKRQCDADGHVFHAPAAVKAIGFVKAIGQWSKEEQ